MLARSRRSRRFESLTIPAKASLVDGRAQNPVIPSRVSSSLPRKSGGKPSVSPDEAARSPKRGKERERERESRILEQRSHSRSRAQDAVEVVSCKIRRFSRRKLTRFRGID